MNIKQVAYYDIETAPFYDDRADPTKDKLRFVGIRLPSGKKVIYEHPQQQEMIQNTLSNYQYLSGHNIKNRKYNQRPMGYDNEVMKRHGYKFKTHAGLRQVFFDTQEIMEKRGRSMMYLKLGQGQFNLRYLTEFFNLVDESSRKGDFDYLLLRKPYLLPSERRDLVDYLHRDLEAGYRLFEYLWNTFSEIKDNVSTINQINGQWLNGASGTTAYRWYCKVTGKPETYDWDIDKWSIQAATMQVDKDRDTASNVLVFDFASLYPSQDANQDVDNRCPEEYVTTAYIDTEKEVYIDSRNNRELYHGGNEVYPSVEQNKNNGLVGYYYRDGQSAWSQELSEKFWGRKGDQKSYYITGELKFNYKQLGKKILMNSAYGGRASAPFVNMADRVGSEDITRSSQCCIRHAKKYLEDLGYWIIYLHTDSLYVVDVYNDNDKLKAHAEEITRIQRNAMNYYNEMHNFDFEKKLEKIWLTKSDDGENLKQRNFVLYKDKEGNLKTGFTGGKLADFNTSKLSKKIWKDVISVDLILGKRDIYYKPEVLLEHIRRLGKENPSLLEIRKKVKNLESYKGTTSQQYKISNMYGAGEHFLVPNKYMGLASSKKGECLAKMYELKEAFGMDWLESVNFSKYAQELSVFIRPDQRKDFIKLAKR